MGETGFKKLISHLVTVFIIILIMFITMILYRYVKEKYSEKRHNYNVDYRVNERRFS